MVKDFKPALEVPKPKTGIRTLSEDLYKITKCASYLVQKLQNSWKVRVLDRVPLIFKLKYEAFNWKTQFNIFENQGEEHFYVASENSLRKYIQTENEFFSLRNDKSLLFNENEVVVQMKRAKKILVKQLST